MAPVSQWTLNRTRTCSENETAAVLELGVVGQKISDLCEVAQCTCGSGAMLHLQLGHQPDLVPLRCFMFIVQTQTVVQPDDG